ncbi:cysteine hydrolase family protein [Variovorax sp. dw_308]|uniref:cysteine hydrolase family protein n=1 Tax=Variovorax sp. dw_308 TaxID=2721546 RepID=UPI001C47D130|nr:isochorismatase family protein [Variovorax sp. dw_308]
MATARGNALASEVAAGGEALLIIDMISCWDFPDAGKLRPGALAIAPAIAAFKKRCGRAGVPTIYANDNLGRWRSDWKALVESSIACGGDAATVTTLLLPGPEDYFVLKPKHSAFHATPLTLLLHHLRVRKIYVAGVSSDQCVMTTVAEARMRDLEVAVPRDLVATQSSARNEAVLLQYERTHGLNTAAAPRIRLAAGKSRSGRLR